MVWLVIRSQTWAIMMVGRTHLVVEGLEVSVKVKGISLAFEPVDK